MQALLQLGLAVLAAAPPPPTAQIRPLVEAVLAAAPAVARSLPAHPMAPALLESCLVAVAVRTETDPSLSLMIELGDAPIGLYALDHFLEQASASEREARCRWICTHYPERAVAARALDALLTSSSHPETEAGTWIRQSGDTRLGAQARLRRGGYTVSEQPWRAAVDWLDAWALNTPPSAAQAAELTRGLLAAQGQRTLLTLLGDTPQALPPPASLLERMARSLEQVPVQAERLARWRAREDDPQDLGPEDLAVLSFLRATGAAAAAGVDAMQAAAAARTAALARFDAARSDMNEDERTYYLLLLAAHCVDQLETGRARDLLGRMPARAGLSPAYAEAADGLRLRLDAFAPAPEASS